MFSKAVLCFFGSVIIVSCVGELQTFHLADFIEFYSSLLRCKHPNSVLEQQALFTDCLSKVQVLPKPPGGKGNEFVDFYSRICFNENAYRKCWESVTQKSKECNSENGKGYPTSFSLVIEAICKDDKGRSFTDKLAKAMEASREMDKRICTSSGEHWMVACKDLDIEARDVCKKHSALSKCIDKLICKEIPMGRLFLDVYHEAGKIEGCISSNATTAKSIAKHNHQNHNRRGHSNKATG